jgi:hypothetical protein
MQQTRNARSGSAALGAAGAVLMAISPTTTKGQVTDPGADTLPKSLTAQLVQDFHGAFGEHHARAVHSKGVILQGSFEPSPESRELSKAALFTRVVAVIVRFSDFTGLPDIPDTSASANPRGLAIKFLLPDGSNLDVVNHSFNGFPVATAAEFGAFPAGARAQPGGYAFAHALRGIPGGASGSQGVLHQQEAAARELCNDRFLWCQRFLLHRCCGTEPPRALPLRS